MILAVFAELLELAWVAPLAVIVVATSYSLGLLGATRAAEHRREGRMAPAGAWLLLAVVAGTVFTAALVAGVGVIVAG